MTTIHFTLNGSSVEVEPRAGESLLDILRGSCGSTSTKDGRQPQGRRGRCLALLDGRPLITCAIPAAKAEGKSILTVEGLSAEARFLMSQAEVHGDDQAAAASRLAAGERLAEELFGPELANLPAASAPDLDTIRAEPAAQAQRLWRRMENIE